MSVTVNALATNNASPIGGLGTTAKIWQIAPQPFSPASITPTGAITLFAPGTGVLAGHSFKVRASGNFTVAGTTPTVQAILYAATPGNTNVILAQSSVRTVTTSASYPFTIEATLQGDNLSGWLQGWFTAGVGAQVDVQAALTNKLTGVNFGVNSASGAASGASYPTTGYLPTNAGNEPSVLFQAALVFGVSNAANVGNLYEFYMDHA
jgi:hypothetical protein